MREVFQKDKERAQWLADVVANPFFKEASVFAIAQYARNIGTGTGDDFRMKGAVEILVILESLHLPAEEEAKQAQASTSKINYAAARHSSNH